MTKPIWGALVFAAAGVWGAEAQQTTFTVTATAGFTQSDYVSGTDYTFIFEVGGFGAQSASSTGFAGG
ncbi:MAG: hypothetical protein MUE42_06170, partial [Opitutaceae bacterium]|nr:hypothetical protein [Opitutaceae bacterium]